MKVTVLLENTSCCGLESAHGLSIYADTGRHKIMLDAGPEGTLLLKNAESLGIALEEIDTAILSHGHYDHAGGLLAFLERNSSATLYINDKAFAGHFAEESSGWCNIGIDERVDALYASRIKRTGGQHRIDDELYLFSDIKTADYLSAACSSLYEETPEGYICDRFEHEQNLLINRNGKIVLISGCAHRGIVNILRRAEDICGRAPDYVFSGFHLTNPGVGVDEPEELVKAVGLELMKRGSIYYTGHCTGKGPYSILKNMMGQQMNYLSGGTTVEI